MARYLELNQGDIKDVSAKYGIKIDSFKPIRGGASNTNYLLNSDLGQCVLTVFDNKTQSEASSIARVMKLLYENQVPVPKLSTTMDGENFALIKDKPTILREFIQGDVHDMLNEHMIHQVGRAMAKMHLIPPPKFLPMGYAYDWGKFSDVINGNIDPDYERWLEKQGQKIQGNLPFSLPIGMIHADLFPENIVFRDGKLSALIDLEDVAHYPLCFDIGMCILGTCREDDSIDFQKVRVLLDAYQEIRPLTEDEIRSLQFYLEYAATALSYWRFWKYHIRYQLPDRAHLHREMMQLSQLISTIDQEKFRFLLFK